MNENDVEQLALERLQELGYEYVHGPTIAPDGESPARQSYSEVVLLPHLRQAVQRLNPHIPAPAREQALREVLNIASPDLITNNQTFHTLLTNGVEVEYQHQGQTRGDKVWLVDFDTPANNHYLAVNQFTIIENSNRRPDVVLFINGLPLVVVELKNPVKEETNVRRAFDQLETYKQEIPTLFTYNALLVISDGLTARAGSLSAGYTRFSAWKTEDGQTEAASHIPQLEVLINGQLNPATLLDLVRHFTVFEKSKFEDPHTGVVTVQTAKKIAYYHQYYAVNKAVESTLQAATTDGNRKGGVFWHTQGSGKSLSMVFYTGKLVLSLNNPTVVVITDRNDLDDQLFDTFAGCSQLLRQPPVQAASREHLMELLQVASGGIVFTTVQKFFPEGDSTTYPQLSNRRNIVVIADEAHRSQYGLRAKEVDVKDKETGQVVGKRTMYGFAKYMRDALPHATFIGFTGTPIESTDINTPALFGAYVDIYDIAQAVADGATVPIYYESRLAKVTMTQEGRQLIEELDEELQSEDLEASQKAKAKWTQLEAIVGHPARLKNVAQDILTHFDQRQEVFAGKAMVVAMSRRIAVELYHEIIALRPQWHSDELDQGGLKVVMTASAADGPKMQAHHTTKSQRRQLAARFKDPDDPLQMVIVIDMWLTGFDAPCLHTLYVDKPMQGHGLMQAIARVNRVYGNKPGGHVVDYLGIAADLKQALSFYAESGGKGSPTETQEDAVNILLARLEVVDQLMAGFNYHAYFTADTSQKLSLILQAEEHILRLENGKDRFNKEVLALSKALALSIPHETAMANKEKVAFFQAVNARLQKFEYTGNGKSSAEIETAVRQVIDQAIVSDQVIDVFDAAGIKKPDISILDDEFLAEVRGMEHENLALELLRKLLNDELRTRRKTNLVQSRKLADMLDDAIRRYQNKLLSTTEVIEELIGLARDIKQADAEGEELGLSTYELAFYHALADNQSAREVMGTAKLCELAIVLVERVRKNATIDWNIKESVRAKMKVTVKRLLRQYGYPPDMQALATETVLQQAELLAEFEVVQKE
ncbi:MAG: type I restriction endonuclease subunit R [Anaerolineae bacterium]|nr:type I restriction endonuclease subunit R [Anaerolineae bacterium]